MNTPQIERIIPLAGGECMILATHGDPSPRLVPSGVGFSLSPTAQIAVSGYQIFPWGADNNLPLSIYQLLYRDTIARPILTRTRGMFWGRGPLLHTDARSARDLWQQWQIPQLLSQLLTDMLYTQCAAYLVRRSVNGKRIATVQHIPVWQCRLAKADTDTSLTPTHVAVSDYSMPMETYSSQTTIYPLYDPARPLAHAASVAWLSMPDFFANPYPLPDFAGGEKWLSLAQRVPENISVFLENNMALRWIVRIPAEYWQTMKNNIIQDFATQGKSVTEAENYFRLEKTKKLDNFMSMLSGSENAGKAYITDTIYEAVGNSMIEKKWEVEQVDLKISDYISTLLKISDSADAKKTGAFSLHASLANVGQTGRSDSGSEQLYAYTNHMLSSVAIPQMVLLHPLIDILRQTAADADLDITFDRPTMVRQQDESVSSRHVAVEP